MTWYSDYPWIVHLTALVFYVGVVMFLARQGNRAELLNRRLMFYVALAAFSALALFGASLTSTLDTLAGILFRLFVYAHAALPLVFYAFARAFIRKERKPYGLMGGALLLALLVGVDLFQIKLDWDFLFVSTSALVWLVGALIWFIYNLFVAAFGTREYRRQTSPLHRNRLAYLALAAPLVFLEGALEMLFGAPARLAATVLQMVGVVVMTYATAQHDLMDLRALLRQTVYLIVLSAFSLVIYLLAFGGASLLWRYADAAQTLAIALLVATLLTVVYQPLRAWISRVLRVWLFDQRYSPQSVVQDFSQRLSARIDLDELAREGRALLENAMGARAVMLALVSDEKTRYMLRPVLAPQQVPPEIGLDAESAVARVLARGKPLLQYDMDRLPQYADLASETRAALQQLHGEVFVPILSRGAWIGVWIVGAKISGDRYSGSDLMLLTTLADQSAVALENARLLADVRAQMRQVRSMRDYLDSTLASIATGVITLDRAHKIISFNRAAEEIFRIPASKALGRPYAEALPPFEGTQFAALLERLWKDGTLPLVRDVTARVAGRGTVHLTLQLSAMRREGEVVGIAIVIEDLTEQARLEMQRRAQEQETQRVRATFEHYVAPSVVKGLLADPRRVTLGGERHLITALFADMHGFTHLAEQLPPEELVKVLNGYLSLAVKTILRYEGTLDKFMGDGVMAIFNAPLPQRDHAWRAACAALALQREVAAYAPKLPPALRMTFRIGIHTGEAVVGNIGTRELMNYTAVGDPVNVAKRLQENAEDNQILISASTYTRIETQAHVRARETLLVRGRAMPVEVFELLGARA